MLCITESSIFYCIASILLSLINLFLCLHKGAVLCKNLAVWICKQVLQYIYWSHSSACCMFFHCITKDSCIVTGQWLWSHDYACTVIGLSLLSHHQTCFVVGLSWSHDYLCILIGQSLFSHGYPWPVIVQLSFTLIWIHTLHNRFRNTFLYKYMQYNLNYHWHCKSTFSLWEKKVSENLFALL